MTLQIWFSNRPRFLSYFLAVLIALYAVHVPMSAPAQEAKYERPLEDSSENAEQLVRELEEVTARYPVLAHRIGLLNIRGFRIPMACVGGVDAVCHQKTQTWCIDNALSQGETNPYSRCLDLANKSCCQPAVVTATE